MIPLYQIPRDSLIWLLLAQAFLIAPHFSHLPLWLGLAWCVTVLWRIQIYRGLWAYPGRWIKYGLVLLCLIGLVSRYDRLIGLEPMVGMLITAFILKLLEMHTRRDALAVIYLGYFVAATEFLFSQSVLVAVYMLLALMLLTTALLGVNKTEQSRKFWQPLQQTTALFLQSLPLMLLLFLILPRVGSLWAVPEQRHAARTGVSDSMSPGDFGRLAKSKGTAFRVVFEGEIPPPRQQYWRGLVLSEFDGRRWTQRDWEGRRLNAIDWGGNRTPAWRDTVDASGEPVTYRVIMEASHQYWLYGLPLAQSGQQGVGFTPDYRLVRNRPVRERFQYSVTSYPRYRLAADALAPAERTRNLALPEGFNPQSLSTARQWMDDSNGDAGTYLEQVLRLFNQSFVYTLEPGTLGRHTVDEFLWSSRRGFCEHFANAFVVMARAAGIPARVVVGYQGGELNPVENFIRVRQADAHAWAEVWLEGRGWVRYDPTAAVAPQRIEQGLDFALSEEEASSRTGLMSLERYSFIGVVNLLRFHLDAVEYNWHVWVMGYDRDRQADFLRNLLGGLDPWRIALVLLGIGVLVLSGVGGWLLWGQGPGRPSAADRLYNVFLRKLSRAGLERLPHEGPRDFARRVSGQRPEWQRWVGAVTRCYESVVYGGRPQDIQKLRLAVLKGR